jgi:hypothetical protein
MDQKCCTKCKTIKPLDQFYRRKRAKDGRTSECAECRNAAVKQWRIDNPERAKKIEHNRARDYSKEISRTKAYRATPEGKRRMRGYRLKAEYGISLEQYEDLLDEQGGVCAICKRPPSGENHANTYLHVDHDHVSGHVRGLLCHPCNTAIGLLGDDPERIQAAASYVHHRS